MRFPWLRALPALLVLGLLALGLAASSRGVRARGGSPVATYYPHCDLLLQAGGASDSIAFVPGGGLTQPIAPVGNLATCSLSVERPPLLLDQNGRMDIVLWNAGSLAPDPTTVTLRSRGFQNSDMQFTHVRFDLFPPIVTRNLPHQADPRGGTLAMNYEALSPQVQHKAAFEPDGPSSTPIAYQYAPGGPRQPLTGPHPVLSHAVCGGDAALQNLYVAQSVMTTDFLLNAPPYELSQTFRVPVAISLRWVELAFGPNAGGQPGLISIVDAQGATTPQNVLPGSMVEGAFSATYSQTSGWASHYDFDRIVNLQPNHDYFLVVRTASEHALWTRTYTRFESNEFFAAVGGLFGRNFPTGGWYALGGRSLSFRVIGEPLAPLDVGPAPSTPAPGALRLRVAPNPSRGASFVTWSGAAGAVALDVIDARGRRVAEVRPGGSGSEGRWMWSAAQRDGRPLPAGVYFVRARDASNHSAVERIVLVR